MVTVRLGHRDADLVLPLSPAWLGYGALGAAGELAAQLVGEFADGARIGTAVVEVGPRQRPAGCRVYLRSGYEMGV